MPSRESPAKLSGFCDTFSSHPVRIGDGSLRNLELKARLADLDGARRVAQAIATNRLSPQHQIDTYFHCRQGRLKLRQIDGLSSQLVSYARADEPGPKVSDYVLVPVTNPESLKAALSATLGVRCVIVKRREVYLHHNVRIHLDEVEGLGSFLEFEAVLGPRVDDVAGQSQLDFLAREFSLDRGDLLSGSYADMVRERLAS